MRQLSAFINKECMELTRTGKFFILMLLFILFGVMNPAIAKLTPWLMEAMSESLSESGLTVTEVRVDALTSWTQFYKNIPLALIIFLLIFSGILTVEYQKGTLINMITKGMNRWKIIAAKGIIMSICWTIGYWICFGITYEYNAYFWDNSIISHVFLSAACFYLMGLWLISLTLLMSIFFSVNSAVIIMTAIIFLVIYLLGFLPDIKEYLPVQLMKSFDLLVGMSEPSEYRYAIIITIILFILNFVSAIACFNKRNI